MRELLYPAIVNGDATGTVESLPIVAQNLFALSAQAVSTGDATGAVKFQASNDQSNPTNWSDISQTVNFTAASVVIIPKFDCCYNFVRVVSTNTSGTTGTISVNVKALGA
jgi:hypothetical protein